MDSPRRPHGLSTVCRRTVYGFQCAIHGQPTDCLWMRHKLFTDTPGRTMYTSRTVWTPDGLSINTPRRHRSYPPDCPCRRSIHSLRAFHEHHEDCPWTPRELSIEGSRANYPLKVHGHPMNTPSTPIPMDSLWTDH